MQVHLPLQYNSSYNWFIANWIYQSFIPIYAMKIWLKSLTFLRMFLTHEKHQKDVLKVGTTAMPTFLSFSDPAT